MGPLCCHNICWLLSTYFTILPRRWCWSICRWHRWYLRWSYFSFNPLRRFKEYDILALLHFGTSKNSVYHVTVWNAQISSYFIHSRFFLNFWGLFFLKTLKKKVFIQWDRKKNKLECLFIFSGGNCTLNLKISQIIFFTFSQKWCGFYKCSNGSDKHQCTQRAKVPFFVQKVNKTLRKKKNWGVKSGLLTSQWSKRKFLSKKFKHKTSKYNFWTKNELLE